MPSSLSLLALCLLSLITVASPTVWAAEPLAETVLQTEGLVLRPTIDTAGFVLTVQTPDGTVVRRAFPAGDIPTFLLEELGAAVLDGLYAYQLVGTPIVDAQTRARARETRQVPQRLPAQSGTFRVQRGAVMPERLEEGARQANEARPVGGFQSLPTADQVILDDLIVIGNECIGISCINGESFGLDVLRLKDVNNRIHFLDTSSGSFPTNDWRVVINSNSSGGSNFFAVEDATAARQVFTIEAAAPLHALYVDSTGQIGAGTATPARMLHLVSGDTPGLRLEQDNSSSFTPQRWDIAANETNFFVADVTAGANILPFRIRTGAPSNSVYIGPDGNVGLGTAAPDVNLHIFAPSEDGPDVQFKIEANTDPAFDLDEQDSGVTWRFINNEAVLKVADVGTGSDPAEEFILNQAGDLTITGEIFTAGSCSGGCDLVFSPDYDVPSIEQHAAQMWARSHLPAVGPTPEQGPFNLSRKVGGILNELEKAHIYIEQLNDRLVEKDQRIERLEAAVEALQRHLPEHSHP